MQARNGPGQLAENATDGSERGNPGLYSGSQAVSEKSSTRVLWLILGWAAVALAVVGAVLPLLPTTPLLLVAAFAFSRSSARWYAWLVSHPQFGPLIVDWRAHGAIARRAKSAATLSLIAVMALGVALVAILWVLLLQAGVLLAVAVFIWSRPEPPRELGVD